MAMTARSDHASGECLPTAALLFLLACLFAAPGNATTYFVAPAGSDRTGTGSQRNPWASCFHDVVGGDVILVEDGIYAEKNSYFKGIRAVAGHGLAVCKGEHFGRAVISSSDVHGAIWVWASQQVIQDFVLSSTGGACIDIQPIGAHGLHDITIDGNMCAGAVWACVQTVGERGQNVSSDYLTITNNICVNSARSAGMVYGSAIHLGCLVNWDNKPGTHIEISGNLLLNNANSSATPPTTDGAGVELDRLDHSDCGLPGTYSEKVVVERNLFAGNGGPAVEVFHSPSAPVLIHNNLAWADLTDPNYSSRHAAEIIISMSNNVTTTHNTVFQGAPRECCAQAVPKPIYAYYDDAGGVGVVANIESGNTFVGNGDVCRVRSKICNDGDSIISWPIFPFGPRD